MSKTLRHGTVRFGRHGDSIRFAFASKSIPHFDKKCQRDSREGTTVDIAGPCIFYIFEVELCMLN